jgi:CPA1 family monovalent cation:H+ antiporter
MLIALAASLVLDSIATGTPIAGTIERFMAHVDFNHALLDSMLGALLFAGALQIDFDDLRRQLGVITVLVTASLLASTLLVGGLIWVVFTVLGLNVAPIYCFLFGALISPTDPVAVLAILHAAGVPKGLETQFTGESLFNDGVAIVVFLILAEYASGGSSITAGYVVRLFAEEALGGIAFGLALGTLAYVLLRGIDTYHVDEKQGLLR